MSSLPEAVIIFGASGFVGRNLAEALDGQVPLLIGVTGKASSAPGCTHVFPISELGAIPALPADTVAIHVAAYRYDMSRLNLVQSDILRFNTELNGRVFDFCANRKIRELRLASSVAVYPAGLDIMDDAAEVDLNKQPYAGEAFYAWSKRWAEQLAALYAAQFGINSIIFRLSNPYGPYDSTDPAKAHVAPAFVMKALNSEPVFQIKGDATVERDFTYVGDVVEAFRRSLLWRERNEVYNVCTGKTVTLQTLAETVLAMAGARKAIQSGAPGAFGPNRRASTSARIQQAMGLSFTSLEEGMRPTIEWYRHALAR